MGDIGIVHNRRTGAFSPARFGGDMNFNLIVKFLYKDGTNYSMTVRIPDSVARQIKVNGLMVTQVYCEPVHGAADNVPRIEDFLKENDIKGFKINGKEIGG